MRKNEAIPQWIISSTYEQPNERTFTTNNINNTNNNDQQRLHLYPKARKRRKRFSTKQRSQTLGTKKKREQLHDNGASKAMDKAHSLLGLAISFTYKTLTETNETD